MAANLLNAPAATAARRIALRHLTDWGKARRRLGRGETEAIHDFRVALRRLRSTLRAFRDELRNVGEGERDRLRRFARITDEPRNLEVWEGWVAEQAPELTPKARPGVEWLRVQLQQRQRAVRVRMVQRVEKRFPAIRAELERLLGRGTRGRERAETVVRRVVLTEGAVLKGHLAEVRSALDREPAHAARISAKRLRYLLEPFEQELPGAKEIAEQLRRLQDELGVLHDAHVHGDGLRLALQELSDAAQRQPAGKVLPWTEAYLQDGKPPPDARAALLELAKRLRREGEGRFEKLRKEWLDGDGPQLLARLATMGQSRGKNRGGRI